MKMISYAQNGEDIMLSRALRDVPHGFYIDVGAAGPTEHSVTRTFYDRGWTGINVEPTERYFDALCAARPHDVNLRLALDERAGEATFFAFEGTGLSTLDADIAAGHRPGGWPMRKEVVETSTLAAVCAAHAPPAVHFLKIDVEGVEARVLRGADFERCRPWVVVVEATRPMSPEPDHAAWEPVLLAARYEFAWFDGLNRFYLAAEKADALRPSFRVPVNYFDDYDLHNPRAERTEQAEAEARDLEAQLQAVRTQLHRSEAERAALERDAALGRAADAAASAARDRLAELGAHVAELRRRLDEAAVRDENAALRFAAQARDHADQLAVRHAELHGRRMAQEHAEATAAHLAVRLRALEEAAVPAPVPAAAAPPARPGALRSVALAVYRAALRPVVRPAMWRTRSFLVNALQHEQLRMRDEQRHALALLAGRADRVDDAVRRLEASLAPLHAVPDPAPAAAAASAATAELVRSVEETLLTLAVTARTGRAAG